MVDAAVRLPSPSIARRLVRQTWQTLLRFPARLRERDFWIIQASIALVTTVHFIAEAVFIDQPEWTFHHIPVILYILPIAYASIRYSWEGGLLTSAWVLLLVLPSVLLWHREDLMWLGELTRVVVVVGVGVSLASRVEMETRLRRRAEAVSSKLATSEAKFRELFEAAGDAILVFDGQGRVMTANAAAAGLFGMSDAHQLVGQQVSTLVPAWEDSVCLESGEHGARRPSRVTVKRANSRDLSVDVVVAALPNGTGEEAYQAVLRDATAQELREQGLRSLVHHVTRAQEEERARIARELHDDTLQALILLARELEGLTDATDLPGAQGTRLKQLAALAASTAEDLRRFSRDLRPSMLDDLGLVPALEWLAADLGRRTSLDAHFRTTGAVRRLSMHVELALFRIVQEALRNVEKHAHASSVEVVLSFESSRILLQIHDDGMGFTAPSSLEEFISTGRLGLVGLKERASLVGGTLEVCSTPGRGTEISVVIPAGEYRAVTAAGGEHRLLDTG